MSATEGSYIHKQSKSAWPPGLFPFKIPATQTGITGISREEIYPVSNIADSQEVIEFRVPRHPQHRIDLKNSFFEISFKLTSPESQFTLKDLVKPNFGRNTYTALSTRQQEVKVKDFQRVTTVNSTASSLFQNVEFFINGVLISDTAMHAHYQNHISNLLNTTQPRAEQEEIVKMFAVESGSDVIKYYDNALQNRDARTADQRVVTLRDTLGLPLSHSIGDDPRYLPNNVDITIRLRKANSKFAVYAAPPEATRVVYEDIEREDIKFNIEITKIKWNIQLIKQSSASLRAFESGILKKEAVFFFPHLETRVFTIPSGVSSHVVSLYPRRRMRNITLALVADEAYNGSYFLNPYDFQHYNIHKITLYENSERRYPEINVDLRDSTPNMTDSVLQKFQSGYFSLLEGLGYNERNGSPVVNLQQWKDGNCLFMFDMRNDDTAARYLQPDKPSTLRIELSFHDATKKALKLVCVGNYDDYVTIGGKDRQIKTSLSDTSRRMIK
jgi:hypothetical protein